MDAFYRTHRFERTCATIVRAVQNEQEIILESDCFYPGGGGQPCDLGILRTGGGAEYAVLAVRHAGEHSILTVDRAGLHPGDPVTAVIDWERRSTLMRMHTAAHLLSAIIARASGALITGNQLGLQRSRIDFSLEHHDPGVLQHAIEDANAHISKGAPVRANLLTREEILSDGACSRLAKGLPETPGPLQVITIEGLDRQVCGGTHVDDLRTIGTIIFTGTENKGKNNRRMYFELSSP
ncbi:MAG: alanyl-tRNA editing protein [Nitrosarchaeum sp.]|nr:alanyl-tRNA editing protein [Nitrosarchaeum sp.]